MHQIEEVRDEEVRGGDIQGEEIRDEDIRGEEIPDEDIQGEEIRDEDIRGEKVRDEEVRDLPSLNFSKDSVRNLLRPMEGVEGDPASWIMKAQDGNWQQSIAKALSMLPSRRCGGETWHSALEV
jgi:hypothetical protein